ncbi:MAG: addiction module protein [Hyphomicrobiaceae bacterium]
MNAIVKSLVDQAQKLTPEERLQIVDEILLSLPPDPEIERQWVEEVQDRIEAVQRGELALVDADEVFRKLRKK